MTPYLDCAATAPVDPRVGRQMLEMMLQAPGNAGSRTHAYGERARAALEKARGQVAQAVGAGRAEVVFTSGATESDNLAILGLAEYGLKYGRRHVVSTAIEHHAVLGPLDVLRRRGFEVTLVPPTPGGWAEARDVLQAVRDDTLLLSVMLVNNETGVIQPIEAIARGLAGHAAYFHVDAAQGFGKVVEPLRDTRVDLISISGHKVHAPQGVGALIARRRGGERPPLAPLMAGGGQEWGLRPGTTPVYLACALGLAAELAIAEVAQRTEFNAAFGLRLLGALAALSPRVIGEPGRRVANIVNVSFPGLDSEAAIEAIAPFAAVSNGSACTSASITCSHVLAAMNLPAEQLDGAVRFSWSHLTAEPDWAGMVASLRNAMG